MFKRYFFQALLASILTFTASIIYRRIYFFATETDFSDFLSWQKLAGLSVLICMTAALVNSGLNGWLKNRGQIVFNFLFSLLSFAAVMIPISETLPLNIQFPELFPGLGVPMVFFPAMAWYTINPFFQQKPADTFI